MKLFLQKNAKFSSAGGSAPRPPCLRRLGAFPPNPSLRQQGASPPDPHWPPAVGGSAPRPPKQPPPLRISGYAPAYLPYGTAPGPSAQIVGLFWSSLIFGKKMLQKSPKCQGLCAM